VFAVDDRDYGISDGRASAAALMSDAVRTYDYPRVFIERNGAR
jgi:hypothetical protein